jgi:uncharacterized protein YecE (DUF72 family)
MTASIRIGTSGYSFADWVGTVYPPGTRPGAFLPFYAKLFDAVEINATYYRTPSPQTFARMVEKTPEGFTFVVKVPRAMTHELTSFDRELGPFQEAIQPLADAGRLGGLLAQFPYAFVPGDAARRHLDRLARALGPGSAGARVGPGEPSAVPLSVEFRHDAWTGAETLDLLHDLGLGFVNVDLPELPHLPRPSAITTSPTGYVRLHGRNATTWWNQGKGGDRYDYLYSERELEPWVTRIGRLAEQTDVVFAFANNCHLGQSVVNALQLGQRLGRAPADDATSLFATTFDERIRDIETAVDRARAARGDEREAHRAA